MFPAATTGCDGGSLVAYLFNGIDDVIRVLKCTAAGCSQLKDIVNPILGFSGHTTIALGVDGFPVITAISRNNPRRIHFVHCKSIDCSSYDAPILIDNTAGGSDRGKYASMSIGSDGLPIISYYDENNTNLKVLKCQTVKCDEETSVVIDQGPEGAEISTSLTIGVDGYPLVAYSFTEGGVRKIKIVKCGNGSCSDGSGNPIISAVFPDTESGEFVSATIGVDGLPIIAYVRYTQINRLRIIHCGSENCVPFWTRR